jgi:hypothetical protein
MLHKLVLVGCPLESGVLCPNTITSAARGGPSGRAAAAVGDPEPGDAEGLAGTDARADVDGSGAGDPLFAC